MQELRGTSRPMEWYYIGFITQDPNDDCKDAVLSRLPSILSGTVMEDSCWLYLDFLFQSLVDPAVN